MCVAPTRTHRGLATLLGLILLTTAWRCEAKSGVAVASAADRGQLGIVVAFHHLSDERENLIAAPITRPGIGGRLVIGLPGALDLHAQGRFGLRLGATPSACPEWDAMAGLRLAPAPLERPVRFELLLGGGMRSVPGYDGWREGMYMGYGHRSASPSVGVARLDSLLALQPHPGKPALLGRFRYENHWIALVTSERSAEPKRCTQGVLASHLWEFRLGLLLSPEKMNSFIVECGAYFYHPQRDDQMDIHSGLVLRMGVASGSGRPQP